MKRFFMLLAALPLLLLLGGCPLTQSNTITVPQPDGTNVTYELSDDSFFNLQVKESKVAIWTAASNCPNCTPEQRAHNLAIAGLSDRDKFSRGMNVNEMTDSVTGKIAPLALAGWVVSQVTAMPNNVNFNGDGNSFSPLEAHMTGSDSGSMVIPYRSPTIDNSMASPGVTP